MPDGHDRKYGTTGKPMRVQLTNAAGPQSIAGWATPTIVLSTGRVLQTAVVDAATGVIDEVIDPLNPVPIGDWEFEVHTADAAGKPYVFPETAGGLSLRVHKHFAQ